MLLKPFFKKKRTKQGLRKRVLSKFTGERGREKIAERGKEAHNYKFWKDYA